MVRVAGLQLSDERIGSLHPKLGIFDSLKAAYGSLVDVARKHMRLIGLVHRCGFDVAIGYSSELVLKVVGDEQFVEAVMRSEV